MDGRAVFTEVEMKGFRKLDTLKMSRMIILEGINGFSRLEKSMDTITFYQKEAKEPRAKDRFPSHLSCVFCGAGIGLRLIFFFDFGLLEIDEAKAGECRTVAFLDRDTLGDEVKLTEIVLGVRPLV